MALPADMTSLGYRVARALHGRWRQLRSPDRERLEPLAEDMREHALDLRGTKDRAAAHHALTLASERLAGAMVESAQADPEVGEDEVVRLRDDLAGELERLSGADVRIERKSAAETPPRAAPHVDRG